MKEGDIVYVKLDKCDFVGFYNGIKHHNGVDYKHVSPYTDKRPGHWLAIDTDIEVIRSV